MKVYCALSLLKRIKVIFSFIFKLWDSTFRIQIHQILPFHKKHRTKAVFIQKILSLSSVSAHLTVRKIIYKILGDNLYLLLSFLKHSSLLGIPFLIFISCGIFDASIYSSSYLFFDNFLYSLDSGLYLFQGIFQGNKMHDLCHFLSFFHCSPLNKKYQV